MTTRHSHFDPRAFGRRPPFIGEAMTTAAPAPAIGDDWRLFAMTYVAGFAFVSIFLV